MIIAANTSPYPHARRLQFICVGEAAVVGMGEGISALRSPVAVSQSVVPRHGGARTCSTSRPPPPALVGHPGLNQRVGSLRLSFLASSTMLCMTDDWLFSYMQNMYRWMQLVHRFFFFFFFLSR
jgi:hypothetical protein